MLGSTLLSLTSYGWRLSPFYVALSGFNLLLVQLLVLLLTFLVGFMFLMQPLQSDLLVFKLSLNATCCNSVKSLVQLLLLFVPSWCT